MSKKWILVKFSRRKVMQKYRMTFVVLGAVLATWIAQGTSAEIIGNDIYFEEVFESAQQIGEGFDNRPREFADVNGDGRADYCRFIGNQNSTFRLSCLLAGVSGFSGTFESAQQIDEGFDDRPREFADVNGDGRADYCRFIGNQNSTFRLSCLLAGVSGFSGTFESAQQIDEGFDDRPREFADVNGDGRADYCRFIGNQNSTFRLSCLLAGVSGFSGTFESAQQIGEGFDDRPRGFADVNGDGRADYCRFIGVVQN
ncbi:VCBS repeat-containing protein [Chloroflexi bacterium TSY]|nr:VCBS repeat-containing protein [Chloroflexi bacterium TSY]